MSIQKYIAFLKTVEYGSFTEAARILDYSQSGISRMINDLEKEWGVSLLERGHSGVRLTSEGIKLMPHIKNICDDYFRLREQIDEIHGIESGLIRIGTMSSVATHWLPGIIKEFRKKYPNIDYELMVGGYDEIETWIMQGRVDCGFSILPVRAELETMFIEKDRLLVVLPKGHMLENCDKFPVKALNDDYFMLLESGRSDVQQIFKRHGIKPNIHFRTLDDYAIMSMVEKGLGIIILPELILQIAPYDIVTKELEEPAYRDIVLAMKSIKNSSSAVKRFIDYINFRNEK